MKSCPSSIDATFSCCAISRDGSLICCGTELYAENSKLLKNARKHCRSSSSSDNACDFVNSYLVFWDPRNLSYPLGTYSEVHSDDINQVHFDPTSSFGYLRLISCSEDGLVNLLDLSATSENDSLLQVRCLFKCYSQ